MKKIYILGLGKGKNYLERCILKEHVEVMGYIDNYKTESICQIDNITVIKQNEIKDDFDYIIVSLMQYENIRQSLICQGIERNKIICFFDFKDAGEERYWDIIDAFKWRTELIWKHYTNIAMPTLDNLDYELYGDNELVREQCPKIIDVDKTVEILEKEKKCLARLGDGEFELMCGRKRADFQDNDEKLAERLKEVLNSAIDNLIVAIADNYGRLDKYTDDAARDIRSYLSKSVRKDHMCLLDKDKQYYDAYLSRPYILYRDKKNAGKRFANIKKIWNDADILLVEGQYTRFGVGNDLLSNAASVSRILVPNKNAFAKYNEVLPIVRKHGKNRLILAVLGPTATVLAYDLSREGYWILDIGQLDVEYEWYLRGVTKRCNIPYKHVSEVSQYDEIEINEEEWIIKYKNEIIDTIL